MIWIRGGDFLMGSNDFYPEESPVRQVGVDGFWMDEHLVTVAQFRHFVNETRYVTVAERPLDPAAFDEADPDLLTPGSLVFHMTSGPVDLGDYANWWSYVPGASWRYPGGPGSDPEDRELHPVTHVAPEDAEAYASWEGKELPTEAEWEFASRGGFEGRTFSWGDEFAPGGTMMANTWQGEFPWQNLGTDGFEGTSPVGSFPANGYGLFDMIGNVWEWTSDLLPVRKEEPKHSCCTPRDTSKAQPDPSGPASEGLPHRVIKGGSHLCAPNYCLRYRPAARQSQAIDTSTSHIGFRCILRSGSPG